jgi:GDPmannose 4,6-dehydratase
MKSVILGVSGQDGSYLAEFLLDKGYQVCGIVRRSSVPENQSYRINHLYHNPNLKLEYGDLNDLSSLVHILQKYNPDEIYNLAAQSHVKISFDNPIYTCNANAIGTLNLLEAIRMTNPKIKMYQASSSEMFGNNIDDDGYQRETTPMNPVSPYGCSKVFGYNITRNYRNAYGMFISNGVLFNHESPRRGINFVTNKVCKMAVEIKRGLIDKLPMGNLDATRDWGHSKDYVKAMWMMLQHDKPDDFVCATGKSHSVRDLCKYVFGYLGMNYENYVIVDDKYLRPEELSDLKGDSTKLRTQLGWEPEYTFETMLNEMIEYWLEKIPEKQ